MHEVHKKYCSISGFFNSLQSRCLEIWSNMLSLVYDMLQEKFQLHTRYVCVWGGPVGK